MNNKLLSKKIRLKWLLLSVGLIWSVAFYAADVTLTGVGTLGTAPTGSWSPQAPGPGDNITLTNGATLTVTENFQVGNLILTGGASSTTVNINDAVTLTSTGTITINAITTDFQGNSINIGNGHLISNNLTASSTANVNRKGSLTLGNGTIVSSGELTMGASNTDFTVIGTGTVTLNGSGYRFGNFYGENGSTVIFNQPIVFASRCYFDSLIINAPVETWHQSAASPFNVSVLNLTLNNTFTLHNNSIRATQIKTDHPGGFNTERMVVTNGSGMLVAVAQPGNEAVLKQLYPIGTAGVYAPVDLTNGEIVVGPNTNNFTIEFELSYSPSANELNQGSNTLPGTWTIRKAAGDWRNPWVRLNGNVQFEEAVPGTAKLAGFYPTLVNATTPPVWRDITSTVSGNKINFIDLSLEVLSQGAYLYLSAADNFAMPDFSNAIYSLNNAGWNAVNKWSGTIDGTKDVYILHTTSMNVANTEVNNLKVYAPLTLNQNLSFTVNGTTDLSANYTINANANAVIRHRGKITINSGYFRTTAATTQGNLIFEGGIHNNGATMESNAVAFMTNNQEITGFGDFYRISNPYIDTGVVLTIDARKLTIGNSASDRIRGAGTLVNKGHLQISYTNFTDLTTTIDATTPGNVVEFSAFRPSIINTTYYDLIVSGADNAAIPAGEYKVLNNMILPNNTNLQFAGTGGVTLEVGGDLIFEHPNGRFRPNLSSNPNLPNYLIAGSISMNGGTFIPNWNANLVYVTLTGENKSVISGIGTIDLFTLKTTGAGVKTADFDGIITVSSYGSGATFIPATFTNEGGTLTFTNPNNKVKLTGSTIKVDGDGLIAFNHLTVGNGNSLAEFKTDVTVQGDLEFEMNEGTSNRINLDNITLTLNGDLKKGAMSGSPLFATVGSSSIVVNGTGGLSYPFVFTAPVELDSVVINRGGTIPVRFTTDFSVNKLVLTRGFLNTDNKLTYKPHATLVYNGADPQTIGTEWRNNFLPPNVRIENPAGVSGFVSAYSGNLIIDGGVYTIRPNQIFTSEKAIEVANGGKIVLESATSELRIKATNTGDLLFPVATENAYSPVTATVATADENYIGVKLVAESYDAQADALKRIWTVTGTTPALFKFQYSDFDIKSEIDQALLYTGYNIGQHWVRLQQADVVNKLLATSETRYGSFTGIYKTGKVIVIPEVDGLADPMPGEYDVKIGGDFVFTINLLPGYNNESIVVKANGNVLIPDANDIYTISNVQDDVTLTIEGIEREYFITLPSVEGVTYDKPAGVHFVTKGSNFTFTLDISADYNATALEVKAGENVITPIDGVYTLSNIVADQQITITGLVRYKLIHLPIVEGVRFDKETGVNRVLPGQAFVFMLDYLEGYGASDLIVKVNGARIAPTSGTTFTIPNIQFDMYVTVEGVKEGHTVTLPIVSNGTLSPAPGTHFAALGSNFTFKVTPNAGNVIVQTKKTGETEFVNLPPQSVTNNVHTYVIENVTSDIEVVINITTSVRNTMITSAKISTTKGKLIVTTENAGQLSVFDLAGVQHVSQSVDEGTNEFQLAAGIYIVVFKGESQQIIVR